MSAASVARLWPTLLAGLITLLGAVVGNGDFVSQHPQMTVLVSAALIVLSNFVHSPAGPRATPDAVMAVKKEG